MGSYKLESRLRSHSTHDFSHSSGVVEIKQQHGSNGDQDCRYGVDKCHTHPPQPPAALVQILPGPIQKSPVQMESNHSISFALLRRWRASGHLLGALTA